MTPAAWIAKKALDQRAWLRPILTFPNARTGFKALLQALGLSADDIVLLPAYVGWSKNEGSGVFDPIREVGTRYAFYRIAHNLSIDLDDLERKLFGMRPRLVVFIHYFGWPDACLTQAVDLAHQYGALVLEDEAHALYSDWVTGICGRQGDAAIVSLHKMLPFNSGGWLVLNRSIDSVIADRLKYSPLQKPLDYNPFDYDWSGIARARCRHAQVLLAALLPLVGKVDPVYPMLAEGVIPQTLPVMISGKSRDDLYFQMNEAGFGLVSLYHTLITEIRPEEYPDSHWLARHLINLPVHQDATVDSLEAMVSQLCRLMM